MRLRKDVDYRLFLNAVKRCEGEVFFETKEDSIALKSALSQYVFMAVVNKSKLSAGAKVRCEEEGDYMVLKKFLTE